MRTLLKHRHLSDERLSEYVSGRLPAEELARTERALASCATCREELIAWEFTRDALRGLPAMEMPSSFVMVQSPEPAVTEPPASGAGYPAMLGIFRFPNLSPWVYAGAASLAGLVVALVVTAQGGLPWTGSAVESIPGNASAIAVRTEAHPQAAMALDEESPGDASVESDLKAGASPAPVETESAAGQVHSTSLPAARQKREEATSAPAAAQPAASQDTSRGQSPEAVGMPDVIDSINATERSTGPAETYAAPQPQLAAIMEQVQPETAAVSFADAPVAPGMMPAGAGARARAGAGADGTLAANSAQTGSSQSAVPPTGAVSTPSIAGASNGGTLAVDEAEAMPGRRAIGPPSSSKGPPIARSQVDIPVGGILSPVDGSAGGPSSEAVPETSATPPAMVGLADARSISPTLQAREADRIQRASKTEFAQAALADLDESAGSGNPQSLADESPGYFFLWLGIGILAAAVMAFAAYLGLRKIRSGENRRAE